MTTSREMETVKRWATWFAVIVVFGGLMAGIVMAGVSDHRAGERHEREFEELCEEKLNGTVEDVGETICVRDHKIVYKDPE